MACVTARLRVYSPFLLPLTISLPDLTHPTFRIPVASILLTPLHAGVGIIITHHDQLMNYMRLLTHAMPIESQFQAALVDHLNAEVRSL